MGVVLNPVAYRVGYKYSWKDAWYSHRLTYSVFVHDVLAFKAIMLFVFYRYFSYKRAYWLYSHLNIYIFNNKIFVNLYLYDANEVQLYYNLARRYKKIGWYRLNSISGWFKGHFFDRKSRIKRFHYFTRTLRFFYDMLAYEDFRYVVRKDRRTVFKLKELHNKKTYNPLAKNVFFFYNKKLKSFRMANFYTSMNSIWLPWEEIKPYRLPFKNMVFHMNHLSVKWWTSRFRLFYKKGIKKILKNEKKYIKKKLKGLETIKEFKFEKRENSKMTEKRYFSKFSKRILNKKTQYERELADINSFKNERRFSKKFLNQKNFYFRYIRSNNRLLFTFLAFLGKLFSTMTYAYDRKIFMRKWVRKVIRFYTYYFFKKTVIKLYGRFVEHIASCLNLNFNIKIYILNNNSVGATFISRFIAIGLRSKFDYLDMIIPIRKNLRRQMYVRKWNIHNLDKPWNYKDKQIEVVAYVSNLKEIFYIRMQRLNNFLRYKCTYKKKYKFFYFNSKLSKNLSVNKFIDNNNFISVKGNKNLHIKLVKKALNELSKFDYKKSGLWFRLVELNLFNNKKLLFSFYGFIWYKILVNRFIKALLNKKMFYYYCSCFYFKVDIQVNKILRLINFILYVKGNVKVKEKYYLKYFKYFYLKNKHSYFIDFFNKYCSYMKLLKKKIKIKRRKKRFYFFCKNKRRKKLSRLLKYIKYRKKRKFKFVWLKNKRNKRYRKKIFLWQKQRKLLFKRESICLNSYIFNKNLIHYFYESNKYFYTNTSNNFILNSFYNGKYLNIFLYNSNKKKFRLYIYYFKKVKYFIKRIFYILNKRKIFKYLYLKKFSRKLKSLYELYTIDKSILLDKVYDLKISLKERKNILMSYVKLINFSFLNLILIYKFFFKSLKKFNLNVKYYNYKFKYFLKKKSLKKKKYEIRYLNLLSVIRYYNKIFNLLKYLINYNNKKFNLNSLVIFKSRGVVNFFDFYSFEKITPFVTSDRTQNMLFYYFNDITTFHYKYNVNLIALKERIRYINLYASLNWEGPKLKRLDEDELGKFNSPIFLYNKTKRMKYFDNKLAILYGYKFHFVGRFTRKQQAANLWYRLGSLANSSAIANVDYAIYSVVMRYSVCTVKVWLYKSKTAPKFKYRVF